MRALPTDPGLRLIAYTDGAARGNPGPAGIGVQVVDFGGAVLAEVARGIGVATNNVAEYTAVIEALERCLELGADDVLVRTDSQLLVEQLAGRYRVKNARLLELNREVRERASRLTRVRYQHVPRERNREADRLANEGVDAWLAEAGAQAPEAGSDQAEPPEPGT